MNKGSGMVMALVLGVFGDVAAAKPTPEEVTEARADCRRNRERYEDLEQTYVPPSSPSAAQPISAMNVGRNELEHQRSLWERSCAYAEALMQEAGMEKPSPPPRAPLPPQEIRIIERHPAPREPQSQVGGTPRRDAAIPEPAQEP